MTNHESHHLIQEIIQSIIEKIEQIEQSEPLEQIETIETIIEPLEQIEPLEPLDPIIEQSEQSEQSEPFEQSEQSEPFEQSELSELIKLIEQREPIKPIEPLEQRTKTTTRPFYQVSNNQYHYVSNCIRFFLLEKGLFECCSQHKFPILSSRDESSKNTHQFYLEYELLHNSNVTGYFCVTNINIEHANYIPVVEFVINGDINVLESFTHDLLIYLCYPNISNYIVKDYSYITTKLNMNINYLSNTIKQKIYNKFGATFLLKNYPSNTPAHWTIKQNNINDTYNKLVTILSGIESIVSYEISSNKYDMRNQFNNMPYKTYFHDAFNSVEVNAELDQYLSQSFTPRSYGKIFTLSLIDSMVKEGLIPNFYM